MTEVTLKEETLAEMAKLYDLPLAAGRLEVLRPFAETSINNANILSSKMMDLEYWELIPLNVVRFPD